MRVGETIQNILKGLEQKRMEGTQRFLKGGGRASGSRNGCLKKKGWNLLTNYGLQMSYFLELWGEINEIYL